MLKKVKISQVFSCNVTNTEKLKDSEIKTEFSTNNPKKISKLLTKRQALTEASTEYLFLLKYPVSITQKLKTNESRDAYTRLYSISKMLKLGAQTVFTQKV